MSSAEGLDWTSLIINFMNNVYIFDQVNFMCADYFWVLFCFALLYSIRALSYFLPNVVIFYIYETTRNYIYLFIYCLQTEGMNKLTILLYIYVYIQIVYSKDTHKLTCKIVLNFFSLLSIYTIVPLCVSFGVQFEFARKYIHSFIFLYQLPPDFNSNLP